MLLIIFLFWREFDLFAALLFALYASVLILLSLFLLYFNRYWGRLTTETTYSSALIADWVIVALLILSISALLFFDDSASYLCVNNSFFSTTYVWFFKLAHYDYWNLLTNPLILSAALMHTVLYKFFAAEVFFLNIYLLLGVVLAVSILYLLKFWLNPSTLINIFSLMRFKFFFFFPTNSRVRAMNKFRRQGKRKSTTHVKYK